MTSSALNTSLFRSVREIRTRLAAGPLALLALAALCVSGCVLPAGAQTDAESTTQPPESEALATGPEDADVNDDRNSGEADAQQSSADSEPQTNEELREYGFSGYAILLSDPEPSRYCWLIEETVRITSDGRKRTSYTDTCVDDETNCLALEPDGYTRETSDSYLRVTWETVSGEALYGSCAQHTAYWNETGTVECLYHEHCPAGGRCVDYVCDCDGQQCPEPGAPAEIEEAEIEESDTATNETPGEASGATPPEAAPPSDATPPLAPSMGQE